MESQSTEEDTEAKLAPFAGEEVARESSPNSSPDVSAHSRQVLDGDTDQDDIQDPGPQENPPPEDPNQPAANWEGGDDLVGLSFPRKLWKIVQNEAFKSVRWNDDGDMVIIEVGLFQKEILRRRGAERIFESNNLKSFIRQLNLYGFSNIRPSASGVRSRGTKKMMIYRNYNFRRDQPALIETICRKADIRNPAQQVTFIPTPLQNPAQQATSASAAKKQKLVPMRHSPKSHHKAEDEENSECQGEAPSDQGPNCTQPFPFSGVWAMSSAPEHPLGNQALQGPSSPGGEGASSNVGCAPLAAAGMEGAGEEPNSPTANPTYESVMPLYNSCYSMQLVNLSAMSQRENPHDEQGDSSHYKCAVCEQVTDNQGPRSQPTDN